MPRARRSRRHRRRHRCHEARPHPKGKTPVVEEGMVDLMAAGGGSGRVSVTTDVRERRLDTELSLICVGTPSAANGSQDQSAMLSLARDLGRVMRDEAGDHVFVFRSTLRARHRRRRTAPDRRAGVGQEGGDDFHLCFQPEFLREGTSIRDYDKPPFTIVGADHDVSGGQTARAVRSPAVRILYDVDPRGRNGQVLLQQLPRAEDHVCERNRAVCEALGVNRIRGDGSGLQGSQLNISPAI